MHLIIDRFPRIPAVAFILGSFASAWDAIWRFVGAIGALRILPRSWTGRRPYPLTYEQQDTSKKEFIKSIDEDAVCDLASRHNNHKPCRIFHTARGSFNACFFVEFPDDGTRWVVRIPIDGTVHNVWAKLQSEVTTMRYIQDKTSIPVPRINAFGRGERLTRDRPTTQAFLILDYVPGQSLDVQSLVEDTRDRRDYFYSQLIDILAQMRQLEFPSAGSLMPDPSNKSDPAVGPLFSISINEMQIQGIKAAPPAAFASVTDFIAHQLEVITEAYRLPMSEQSFETAQQEVFALEHLKGVLSMAVDARWDNGPFVLSHLDLRWPNIIVDDELNILAVIDWEWAGSIPRELFTPPSWIAGREPPYVAGEEYVAEFAEFRKVLLVKAEASNVCRQLAEEWDSDLPNRTALPIAELLRHHSQLIDIFYSALYPKLFDAPKHEVIAQFFESSENSELAWVVQQRFQASERYTQYLKSNGLFVPDVEAEKARKVARAMRELEQQLKALTEGTIT